MYTTPWESKQALVDTQPEPDLQSINFPIVPNAEGCAEAHAYYTSARKRLGLLGSSIEDMQCLFFASVYEKFCLRPLQAWLYIQQTSSRLQIHLLKRNRQPPASASSLLLEQRIFWSCFRSERYVGEED